MECGKNLKGEDQCKRCFANYRIKEDFTEEEDDDEGYDPTDICMECGKLLKGEDQCKKCFTPNMIEDELYEDDNYETECAYNQKAKKWIVENCNKVVEQCTKNQDLIKMDIDLINENINELDGR